MYFKYDSFKEVKNELEKQLEDYRACVKAWEAVTLEKKKNGEEMASLGRALKNARVGAYYPVEDSAHPYITVVYQANGYKTDNIKIFFYSEDSPADGRERAKLGGGYGLRDTYAMTQDDIRESLRETIKDYTRRIVSLEKQISACEDIFNEYRSAISAVERRLKERDEQLREAGDIYPTPLYYRIKETI